MTPSIETMKTEFATTGTPTTLLLVSRFVAPNVAKHSIMERETGANVTPDMSARDMVLWMKNAGLCPVPGSSKSYFG